MLPSTVERVPLNTTPAVNQQIQRRMEASIEKYRGANRAEIRQRIAELDEEWDTERLLEANASTLSLVGLAFGVSVHKRWLLLPAFVSGFLLQHALQGWCPPLPIFRRLGVRTASEIDVEKYALKKLIEKK